MAEGLSKTQVDRLGERIRDGSRAEADLILLDQYRLSFGEAYTFVHTLLSQVLRDYSLGCEDPTGREAKSTSSIIEKLRRESIRLTQIQDIAGCRVVVTNVLAQDWLVNLLVNSHNKPPSSSYSDNSEACSDSRPGDKDTSEELLPPVFQDAIVNDRRNKPSHGYRAVHIVVKAAGKPVEIQIRSRLQQLWAELSEKFSDELDPAIKYGGGDEEVQGFLSIMSMSVTATERLEKQLSKVQRLFDNSRILVRSKKFSGVLWLEKMEKELEQAWRDVENTKEKIAAVLEETINMVIAWDQGKSAMAKASLEQSWGKSIILSDMLLGLADNMNRLMDSFSGLLLECEEKLTEEDQGGKTHDISH